MSWSQFNNHFNETVNLIERLAVAKSKCVVYSVNYWELDEQIAVAYDKLTACTKAAIQASQVKYTTKGDFSHLPAVGSVSF